MEEKKEKVSLPKKVIIYVVASFLTLLIQLSLLPVGIAKQSNAQKRDGVSNLIMQMSSVINSRKPSEIKNFFEYYAAWDAVFHIETRFIKVGGGSEEHSPKRREITMDREEYIKFLSRSVTEPEVYGFEPVLESFVIKDNRFALSTVSIKEIAVYKTKNAEGKKLSQRLNVDMNCSLVFDIASSAPIIRSENCIEEVTVEEIYD